ncbi:MAG: four helix bundle protein [Bacteroidota bacterium]
MIHKNLEIWKRSMKLVLEIYTLTKEFPSDEKFGLATQMRRAAVSIPSNIAEGAARKSTKELRQFLYISIGSLAELDTQILIAKMLKYINPSSDAIQNEIDEIRAMILSIVNKLSQ